MKKYLPLFVIGIAVFISLAIVSTPAIGVTILPWNATDTISTARTNINTSLSNLNSGLPAGTPITSINGSTSSTQTFATTTGIGVATANGVHTFSNTGVTSITGSSSISASASTGAIKLSAKNYPIQFIIENPTATENDGVFIFRTTSTITSCSAVNKTTTDSVTFGLGYSSSRATATSSLFSLSTSSWTVTATTTPVSLLLDASTTPGINNPLIFYTTAASSTQLTLSCFYEEN